MSGIPCSWPRCPNTTRRGSGRCHVHRYADRGSRDRQVPAWIVADLDATVAVLRTAFGADARIVPTAFVSGAPEVDVHRGRRSATLRRGPEGGWDVAIDSDSDSVAAAAAVGRAADDRDAAVAFLHARWSPHAAAPAPEP